MKLNGKNLIFDDDVTLTGDNSGKKLSDILGELQAKNKKLESYLKWIYNYGGVGGSGSGSGSSDSSSYILYSTLNGIHLNNQVISLGKAGTYTLRVEIQKPQGASFSISYRIVDSEGNNKFNPVTATLSIDNSYAFETKITLDDNATIIVEATDSVYAITKQESASYVTKSYDVNINFQDDKGNALSEEITTSDAKNNGLNINIDYSIAVSYKELRYTIVFNTGSKIITIDPDSTLYKKVSSTDTKGTISFDLVNEVGKEIGWAPSDETAGYYSVQVTVEILIEGSSTTPIEKSINFNLIPYSLYLLVTPSRGTIYTEKQNSLTNVYTFSTGAITFNVKPYYGSDKESSCDVVYFLDNRESEDEEITIPSSESTLIRQTLSCTVYTTKVGWNKVRFKVSCQGNNYPSDSDYKDYYFYVKAADSSIDWYTSGRTGTYNYFRGGTDTTNNTASMKTILSNTAGGGAYLRQSANNSIITQDSINRPSETSADFHTVIHCGIQYNEVNSSDAVILTAKGITTNSDLTITQDTITFGSSSISYYLPKTANESFGVTDECLNSYHLLSVLFRFVKQEGYNYYYEFSVYIDGILEGTCQSYVDKSPVFTSFSLGSANTIFNLIELSYPTIVKNDDNTTKPEDFDIYQYYLKYKSEKVVNFDETKFNTEKLILTYVKNITITDWGDVYCDIDTVNNIATYLDVPTLVMTMDNGTNGSEYYKTYLENSYDEASDSGGDSIPVALKWAKSGNALVDITFPDSWSAAFYAKIQGSSTKSYKCKNYSLTLKNTDTNDESDIYLYSPNFSPTDTDTFLPEQSFTLKADVVDSSHSNNTSLGKFINDVTTKFSTGGTTELESYVKNCLEGFPFVLYIQFVSKDPVTETETKVCYYQGVYNFNLGRESFYNLGYKDLSVFCNSQGRSQLEPKDSNSFYFYKVSASNDRLKDGIIVAEIQGNSPYLDFSQYDDTILYKTYDAIKQETYMFDDFVTGSNPGETDAKVMISNLVKKVSKSGGYLFDYLKKSYSNNASDNYGYDDGYEALKTLEDGTVIPANQVPNYRKQFVKKLVGDAQTFSYDHEVEAGTLQDLKDLIEGDIDSGVPAMFDYNSLSEYYTICMAFGLVDSVQKNFNIKCWNANPLTNRALFYAAFYDMDTCLGINNAGEPVSYFAFSDYWSYDDDTTGSIISPSQVTIYRDFSPKSLLELNGNSALSGEDFYDTASSYIFAVAKYARFAYGDSDDVITPNFPRQLWARWRNPNTSLTNKGLGCLRNANAFMDNYFANNLGKVAAPLISMNYRNKYLVKTGDSKTGTSFSKANWEKFKGTRIAKTTDWLASRFHIIDAYFNLTTATSTYRYYDENGDYVNLNTSTDSSTGSALSDPNVSLDGLSNNSDIIVLTDIFTSSSNETNQGTSSFDFNVRAAEYSPLIIKTANDAYRYLLGGDNLYNIKFSLNGMQTYTFGGSGAWTYLDSINTFGFSNLYVNSKYLESLSGTANNKAMTVSANSIINMPSLRDLVLTGKLYSGNLEISGQDLTNLNSVTISGSKINLNLHDSNLTSLDISNLDSATSSTTSSLTVSVTNCTSLTSLKFGSGNSTTPATKIGSCVISPVPAAVCKSTSKNNDSGGLCLDYTAIKSLSLTNKTNTSGYSRFKITNDSAIETLTLSGFAMVYISNCTNLKRIVISDNDNEGDKLTRLYIDNCGTTLGDDGEFNIGNKDSVSGNNVDLSESKSLEYISIKNCTKIKSITLDSDTNHLINLPSQAFYGDINLQYFNAGNAYITGVGTFQNCKAFTLRKSAGNSDLCLRVASTVTSLSSTFSISGGGGQIDYAVAKLFVSNGIENGNNITSISYMFYGQSMTYNSTHLNKDLTYADTNPYYSIDMSKFTKVNDVSYCFGWCGNITAWAPAMFTFGSAVNKVTTTGYLCPGNKTVIIPSYVFRNCISKMTCLAVPYNSYITFSVVNSSGNALSQVNVKDIFHPTLNGTTYHPTYMSSLEYFGFNSSVVTNLEGTFENWDALTTLTRFMGGNTYADGKVIGLDGLFSKLPNLSSITNILTMNNVTTPVEWSTFFNWEKLFTKSGKILKHYDTLYEAGAVNFYKYITRKGFNNLLSYLGKSNWTSVSFLFYKCLLIDDTGDTTLDLGSTTLSKITEANGTFYNFRIIQNDASADSPIKDAIERSQDSSTLEYIELNDVFKALPNVTYCPYMFKYGRFSNAITADFFHKRKETRNTVYVLKDGKSLENDVRSYYDIDVYGDYFEDATMHTFKYDTTMTEVSRIFESCRWKEEARSYDPTLEVNKLSPNYIETSSGRIIDTVDSVYYLKSTRDVEDPETGLSAGTKDCYRTNANYKLAECTEITDAEIEKGTGSYVSSRNFTSSNINRNNFIVQEESIDRLFVAPDFLYALVSSTAYCKSIFANNDENTECLEGMIPENFMKANKNVEISNNFKNLNIIPRKYGRIDDGDGNYTDIYYYVPSNFTNYTILSSTFNFNFMFPPAPAKTDDGDHTIITKYYILLNDSISKNTSSLNGAFPSRTNNFFGDPWPRTDSTDYEIYYNIMYNKDTGEDGININTFTKLNPINLVSSYLSGLLNGLLFTSNSMFDTINAKRTDDDITAGNQVIDTVAYTNYNFVSCKLILPKVSNTTNAKYAQAKFIKFTATQPLVLKSSQLQNDSNTIKQYKTMYYSNASVTISVVD